MLPPMSILSLVVSFPVLNEVNQTVPKFLNKTLEFMAAFCEVEDREALD